MEDLDSDEKRLQVLREIMSGWDFINAVWREIDYWMEHRQLQNDAFLLELESMSPEKIATRRLSIRSSISKYQNKVETLECEHVKSKDLKTKNKLFRQLSKAKETLERNELRLARINQMINE